MTRTRKVSSDPCTIALALGLTLGAMAGAQSAVPPTGCNAPLRDAITHVKIADRPFDATSTHDGCWIFVSTQRMRPPNGVVVLHRDAGKVSERRFVPISGGATGMVLTHDEKMLIVASGTQAVFLDVAKLTSGGDPILGAVTDADFMGTIQVIVTADDRWAFISQERTASITVVDLAQIRAGGVNARAIVGAIPAGQATVGLALSPDGHFLYSVSEAAPPRFGFRTRCAPEQTGRGRGGATPPNHSEGLLQVIDVAKATTNPAQSVVSGAPAGCNPVRIVLSPDGATAYITARGEDALLAFDVGKLRTDPLHAQTARVEVGESPVGLAVFDNGAKVAVANSNRFTPGAASDLTIVDAARVSEGRKAVLGTIPAGSFPRQLSLSADGQTLMLTNFASGTLELLDVTHLPIRKP